MFYQEDMKAGAVNDIVFQGPAGALHARDWGGDGLPALLLHGMSGNTHWWDAAAPLLAGLRPIALDLRGHGESGWARSSEEYQLPAFAGDVEAAVRSLGLRQYVLAAHSFGARVALEYASTPRPGLGALALLDFLCEVRPGALDRFTRARSRMQPVYPSRRDIESRFRLQPPGTLLGREGLAALAPHCVKAMEDGRWTWRFDWRAFSIRFTSVWPTLGRVRTRTLVLRGERSTTMPRDHFERVLGALAGARGLEVAGAYHHVPLDAPGACADALSRFFGDSPGPASP